MLIDIIDINTSILFLGHSQTFVGLLSTIVILCVIIGKDNFLYTILLRIAENLQKTLDDKNTISNVDVDDVKKTEKYKLLQQCAGGKTKNSVEDMNRAQSLLDDINTKLQEFSFSYITRSKQKHSPDLAARTKEPEHFLAPLYCFLFTLLLFLFDEALRTSRLPYNNFFISVLTIFTVISFIRWIINWSIYTRNLLTIKKSPKKKNVFKQTIEKFLPANNNSYLRLGLLWLLFIIVAIGVIFINIPVKIRIGVFYSFVIVFPIIIVSFSKPIQHNKGDNPQYQQLIMEFISFFFVSIIITGITFLLFTNINQFHDMWMDSSKYYILKASCVVFVILNGIFCPLALPFICFSRLCKTAPQKKQDIVQKKFNTLKTSLEKKMSDFCLIIKTE